MSVRRQSQGFSRGTSTYRGVTHHPSGEAPPLQAVPALPDLCLSRLHHRADLCGRRHGHQAGPALASVGRSHHRCGEARGLYWTVRHASFSWPPLQASPWAAEFASQGCLATATWALGSLNCCRTCMLGRCPSGSPAATLVCLSCLQPVRTGWLPLAALAVSLSDLLAASAPAQALCCLQGAGRHALESLAASTSTWACTIRQGRICCSACAAPASLASPCGGCTFAWTQHSCWFIISLSSNVYRQGI